MWSDIVFDRAVSTGACDEALRSRFVGFLLASGYFFTRLTPKILIQIGAAASWELDDYRILGALKWFALPDTLSQGVYNVAALSMLEIWRRAPSPFRNAHFIRELVKQLRKRHDGLSILREIRKNLPAICSPDYVAERDLRRILDTFMI